MQRKIADPTTLGECVRTMFPESSGRTRKQFLEAGRVRVNGVTQKIARTPLAAGDVVEVGDGEVSTKLPRGVEIIHEDDDLLVIVKGPNLLTVASDRVRDRTVYAFLTDYVQKRAPEARVFIVHRLDRLASGLLVFAKTPEMKIALQAQFEAHTAERVYVAVVEGRPERREGVIDKRLAEDPTSGKMRAARATDVEARDAITRWRVLREGTRTTTLEVRLETGRKNQIRVHLASVGHPIVGDETYGSRVDPIGRLALHARTLAFDHPRTGARLRFESPPPSAFQKI
ncbi:MAG: RluA family pseudouridine synthase [Planctomycetes bacterium]|nr:RluA family pseudouridine synthase [Planctomycetota bacterium]MBI3847353.1 RluA family pseudouridine synthase [Planctomycetota bacterium]